MRLRLKLCAAYMAALTVTSCCFSSLSAAQQPPHSAAPELITVSEVSTPTQMLESFVFSQSIHNFTGSKIFWQFSKGGITLPTQSVFATLDGAHPDTITIPIASADVNGNDAVSTYVELIDASNNIVKTTLQYQRDLSVFKVLSDSQGTISTLTQQVADGKTALAAKQASIEAMLHQILPQSVSPPTKLVSDNKIELTYTTLTPGRLLVVNTTTGASKDSEQGTTHTVLFDKLSYSTVYTFTATILNLQGNPTGIHADPISITTLDPLPVFNPQVSITSTPGIIAVNVVTDPTGSFAPFTSAIKTAFAVSYRQQVSTAPLIYGPAKQAYSIDLDAQGMPSDKSLSTTSNFTITGLQEGQTYALSIKGIDEFGQSFSTEASQEVQKTPPPPTPLDFDGPVNFQITAATGLTASWKATTAPKSGTAALLIQFANSPGDTLTLAANPDPANALLFKVSSSNSDLLKAVNAALTGTPTIMTQMTDALGKTVNRQFIITFGVQNANKNVSPSASSTSATTAANNLVNASNNPTKNKLSWQDLVSSGLGIVLKAL